MRTQSVSHRGHGVPFIAPVAFSVLWSGGRGRALISVPWLFHAARKVCPIAPEVFIHSVARRTREDASAVPRLPLPMNWQHNQKRKRRPRPFCGFSVPRFSDLPRQWVSPFCSRADARARKACPIAGTECVSSRQSRSPFRSAMAAEDTSTVLVL